MREPIGDFEVVSEDEWNGAREKLLAEDGLPVRLGLAAG
jgi:hypothetical protein